MRLSLLLIMLPFLAQAQYTNPVNFYYKKELRIGLQTQMDWKLQQPYVSTNNTTVLRMDRPRSLGLDVDYQLLKNKKFLYATAGVSYYQVRVPGDSSHFIKEISDYRWKFQEESSVDYWQFSLGISSELFGNARCSPYIQANALIAVPLEATYEIRFNETSNQNVPNYLFIQNGTRTSIGFQIRSGLRLNVLRRISLSAGLYYANINLKQKWPELPRRPLGDTFMKLENGGLEFSCQYRIGLGKKTIPRP